MQKTKWVTHTRIKNEYKGSNIIQQKKKIEKI